jgi:hypothetical protein
MTANFHNKWLKKHIESNLIPTLQEMGFEWQKQRSAKEVGREIVLGWPWGSMRRRNDKTMDIIEICLRKRDRSFFRLNAASCPLEGARDYLNGKHYSADEIHTDYLEECWAMVPRFSLNGYFGIQFKLFHNVTEADYEKLVGRVVSYLPEIEQALTSGKVGPHMKHIRNPRMYK